MPGIASILQVSPEPFIGQKAAVARVRAVLMREQLYLLAQPNSRRRERFGKWGLPGGRIKGSEKPKACLRRELIEELDCRVPYLLKLGDWTYADEQYRVFGCEIDQPIDTFDSSELRAIGWFSYDEVAELANAEKLRTGFELAAIAAFQRRLACDASR